MTGITTILKGGRLYVALALTLVLTLVIIACGGDDATVAPAATAAPARRYGYAGHCYARCYGYAGHS